MIQVFGPMGPDGVLLIEFPDSNLATPCVIPIGFGCRVFTNIAKKYLVPLTLILNPNSKKFVYIESDKK